MAPLRNARHERLLGFLIFDGLNGADAYLRAGFTANNRAVARAGVARVLAMPDVRRRKAELEAEIAGRKIEKTVGDCERALDARAECLRDLRRARDLAFKQEKAGEAGELVKKIATLEGIWTEQTAVVTTVSDLRVADDTKLLSLLFGAQQITTEQKQSALQTLLERRRQLIEHKPAVDPDDAREDQTG
jgi:hypothetical protein